MSQWICDAYQAWPEYPGQCMTCQASELRHKARENARSGEKAQEAKEKVRAWYEPLVVTPKVADLTPEDRATRNLPGMGFVAHLFLDDAMAVVPTPENPGPTQEEVREHLRTSLQRWRGLGVIQMDPKIINYTWDQVPDDRDRHHFRKEYTGGFLPDPVPEDLKLTWETPRMVKHGPLQPPFPFLPGPPTDDEVDQMKAWWKAHQDAWAWKAAMTGRGLHYWAGPWDESNRLRWPADL